jgi:hypothetical protein
VVDSTAVTQAPRLSTNVKRALFLVFGPALVAGFFSILPTIYDQITKPRTTLSYDIVSGPSIFSEQKFLRIFTIDIEDAGKTPLLHVMLEVRSKNNQIDKIVTDNNALHPKITATDATEADVTIDRMLPGDRLRTSVMTRSNSDDAALDVNVRSDEVVGTKRSEEQNAQPQALVAILGALFSAISVLVMVMFYLFDRRRRGFSLIVNQPDRADLVTFIAGLSGVISVDNEFLKGDHDVTYLRLGDLFFFKALNDNDEVVKGRCMAGMNALLLVPSMFEGSVNKIRENLEFLNQEYTDGEFQNMREKYKGKSEIEIRRGIFAIFQGGNISTAIPGAIHVGC